jgi:hypothetical protein
MYPAVPFPVLMVVVFLVVQPYEKIPGFSLFIGLTE